MAGTDERRQIADVPPDQRDVGSAELLAHLDVSTAEARRTTLQAQLTESEARLRSAAAAGCPQNLLQINLLPPLLLVFCRVIPV